MYVCVYVCGVCVVCMCVHVLITMFESRDVLGLEPS